VRRNGELANVAVKQDYGTTFLCPIQRLRPSEWNPRLIRDARFKNLCESLSADPDFLWDRPILATPDGAVFGGNMRLRAAQQLGWSEVPARIVDIPEQLAKERALRDNQNWGEWVEQDLAELLYGLKESGSDLDLLGFDSAELDRLLASVSGPELMGDPDEVPEPPVDPITKPGDLWLLGEHRVLCGDSTNLGDVERLMGGQRAAMLFTDPPYGVAYHDTGEGAWGAEKLARKKAGLVKPRFDAIESDDLSGENLRAFWRDFLVNAKVAMDAKAPVYCCFASLRAPDVFGAYADAGYEARAELIWLKSRPGFNFAHYKHQHEPILYGAPIGGSLNWYGDATQVSVLNVKSEIGRDYEHPTQKPSELAGICIRNSSRRGDIVLDLFGGSGSTLIAAERLSRKAYLMEIESKYVDVIVARWEKLTGRKAVLEEAAVAV
jgi:DNA modification methylase